MYVLNEIQEKLGCVLPDCYTKLYSNGLIFDNHSGSIVFSDINWLDADEILSWEFFHKPARNIVPFAATERRDIWCWLFPYQNMEQPVVLFWAVDLEIPNFYAESMELCLIRMLIEELSSSWLSELQDLSRSELSTKLHHYIEELRKILPISMINEVVKYAQNDVSENDDGTFYLINDKDSDYLFSSLLENDLHDKPIDLSGI